MPSFGNGVIGASYGTTGNFIMGSWFTCPENGLAVSISVYGYVSPATGRIKAAIYRLSDLALIGVTEEGTGYEMPGVWATLNFLAPEPTLELGVEYLLVAWSTLFNFFGEDEAGKGRHKPLPYDGWPNPLTGAVSNNRKLSIICNYTAGPAPTHMLRLASTPISVPVIVDGLSVGSTPVDLEVEEGLHSVEVPSEIEVI